MNPLREAAQQALEALEWVAPSGLTGHGGIESRSKAITNLRAALAHQAEPVQDSGFWGRVAARQASRIKQLETAAQQALGFVTSEAWGTTPYMDVRVYEDAARLRDVLQAALAQEQAEPTLTIERLRDALVASRIIPPAAVEDPDEYDDGVTLHRIEALHRRLT